MAMHAWSQLRDKIMHARLRYKRPVQMKGQRISPLGFSGGVTDLSRSQLKFEGYQGHIIVDMIATQVCARLSEGCTCCKTADG
jgi:hypothetical protein